jgi:LuxR family maltose regulon positive regulatory protein
MILKNETILHGSNYNHTMNEGLLKTKLFAPPPRPNQVSRKTLLDKLSRAQQRGVPYALISAPAGFGKTSLVSAWALSSGLSFAWLALDESDLVNFSLTTWIAIVKCHPDFERPDHLTGSVRLC